MSEEAFVYEAIRTPRGKQKNGSLHEVKPLNLVVGLIEELRKRNAEHPIEVTGKKLRGLMSWVDRLLTDTA